MFRTFISWLLVPAAVFIFGGLVAGSPSDPAPVGVAIHYQLPLDGPLPRTYRVTLAAVDAKNPNWIISTFAAGVARTVTAENQGKFSEVWDGLDENFMPVPPGAYGVKGIFMPAEQWAIDGQFHSIVPKLVSVGASWGQTPAQDAKPDKIEGDPVGAPLRQVDVQPNGRGVVYFQYLENGTNAFLTDFTRPIGYDQIVTGYSSGGIGGGTSACSDGNQSWILSEEGRPFIVHADGTPFGGEHSAYCNNVYLPEGRVLGMTAWPGGWTQPTLVFLAEGEKIVEAKGDDFTISASDRLDEVVALDGGNAARLAGWKIDHPLSVKARGGKLYVLHGTTGRFEVAALALDSGWKQARFERVFRVPAGVTPFDLEADQHGRFYLSDPEANHVYQLDAAGKILRTYGRLTVQKGGTYDANSFLRPEKLGCWTDARGVDRLLVVEQAGPNRLSEWSGQDGKLLREWVTPQTMANDGYAVDPRHPDTMYVPGPRLSLVRWKIDYGTGQWKVNAVWNGVGTGHDGHGTLGDLLQGLAYPRIVYRGDDVYLAYWRGYGIYHLEGERWRACTAVLSEKVEGETHYYLWRDLNGDGQVQENEYRPFRITPPPGVFSRYFGDTFFDDLSFVGIGSGTPDIWRLAPSGFDRRGTPLFDPHHMQRLLTDDVFVAKKAGMASATRGGNEMASDGFDSAWASVAGAAGHEIYVNARSGPDFSANLGGQFKLSRYDPDGKGGYVQRWRVGRMAFQGNARPGEVYGAIYVCPPVNGLVGLIDSARAGLEIYTTDGLYVDTLFPDAHTVSHDQMGAYWQPGEYFSGYDYVNRDNGKVYLALGKTMPKIYEAQGWTTTQNQVRALTAIDRTVTLRADEIAAPPELVMQVRGGPAAARVAQFSPVPGGGPALDGSMSGWGACDPVKFAAGRDQNVEVRCAYDPGHLYLRWQVRLGHDFEARDLDPIQHVFAHGRGNDTLGLYLQGDPQAPAGGGQPGGRPGDVRFVFALGRENGATRPVVLGLFPSWNGPGAAPMTYTSPVGRTVFARVAPVAGVRSGYKIDGDGRGFVLAAAIPRAAIPGPADLNGWHTAGNFDATFNGVNRFWWSNVDGSASRETFDEPTEARFFPGAWSPVQFQRISSLTIHSWMAIGPFGFAGLPKLPVLEGRPAIVRTLESESYPPDGQRDFTAAYEGNSTRTRAAQRRLTWQPVESNTDTINFASALGWPGITDAGNDEGVCYLVTHIHAPQATAAVLNLKLPDGDHPISGQLNGTAWPAINRGGEEERDVAEPLQLRAGWNEVVIRYTHIWGENSIGVSLQADPEMIWKLKVSGPAP